ncbi:putative group XIIA secretory phospholipase A2 [Trichinella spiralis]|uniref:putative group XIIA secretory phospholipase A2 n=1 Tax=Trichinella spiralis TaxID=6334 RepID=UPI0001EFC901|nr:putative group XIIA secretory phospholipase A2 [Trichinella spiralis]
MSSSLLIIVFIISVKNISKKYDEITSSISPIVKRSSYKTSEVHAACIKQMKIKYKFYLILLLQRASLLRKRFAALK